jgi:arylsulfatase A
VPFGARWPGHIPPKSQLTDPAMLADLFPTVCEAAGVNHSHDLDGVSLLPALRQHAHLAPRDLYFVVDGEKLTQKPVRRRALRRGDWKLVDNGHGAPELYDLKTDPHEIHDESAAKPELVQELSAALAAHARRAEGFGAHSRHS